MPEPSIPLSVASFPRLSEGSSGVSADDDISPLSAGCVNLRGSPPVSLRKPPSSHHPLPPPRRHGSGGTTSSAPRCQCGGRVIASCRSDSSALSPLPLSVPLTCPSKSLLLSCFPHKARTSTDRLCSAGSRCRAVPRRLRSYSVLRLPATRRPRLIFPSPSTYLPAPACSYRSCACRR